MAVRDGYRVRPSPEKGRQDVFKILLSPTTFLLLGIKSGDMCYIQVLQKTLGPAIAWHSSEKIKDDVVQVSKFLQELYGLRLDNRVSISPSDQQIANACDIILREVRQDNSDFSMSELNETDRLNWAWILKFALRKADVLAPGMIIEIVDPEKRQFQIQRINSSDERAIYRIQPIFTVRIIDSNLSDDKHCALQVSSDGLGGLEMQLAQINAEVSLYCHPFYENSHLPEFVQLYKGGLLLHGPSGTGKSLVLQKIAEAGWQGVYWITPEMLDERTDQNEIVINQIFVDALSSQPSVVLIDHIDSHNNADDASDSRPPVGSNRILHKHMDRLNNSRTLVVGAARALSNLDQSLRCAKRFARDIEFHVPDSKSRAETLNVLGKIPKDRVHPTLDRLAARTHGFVGGDLELLFDNAIKIYYQRTQTSNAAVEAKSFDKVDPWVLLTDMAIDFDKALLHVHPSAMRDIFIEPPNVRWTDIGGQHEVKRLLEEAVVWPYKYPKILRRHGLKPKKGLLLYGPPGCSKTMVAKAVATEAGLNFIAIRGAELTTMYVGESERKLREIFRKARAVRPSIIFFDELDAIGASQAHSRNGAIQTVTTLLNELDGFQAMEGVFVLAATNKPEILDLALIRAGRFDTCLYVGLPDAKARLEILRLQMLDMQLGHDIDEKDLVEATDGFSGAEIAQSCQEACTEVAREEVELQKEQLVCQRHFKSVFTKAERSTTVGMVRRYQTWGAARH